MATDLLLPSTWSTPPNRHSTYTSTSSSNTRWPCHRVLSASPSRIVPVIEEGSYSSMDAVWHSGPKDGFLTPYILVGVLHECNSLADARQAHNVVVQSGLDSDTYVGTNLIQAFGRFRCLDEACQAFSKVKEPNVYTWTSIMNAYSRVGQQEHSIKLYHKMCEGGIDPDGHAVVSVLAACTALTAIEEGIQIHDFVVESGMESNVYVGNALITMYTNCGSLEEASTALSRVPLRDVVSWSALIGGYIEHGYNKEAFELIEEMHQHGVEPNLVTYVHIIESCSDIDAVLGQGMLAHACAIQNGFDHDELLGSAMVHMYVKNGLLKDAHKVFDELPRRDVVTWTSLIGGYAEGDEVHAQISLELYEKMQLEGIQPNSVAYLSVLTACANLGDLDNGKQVHHKVTEAGLDEDIHLSSGLIDLYLKCGKLEEACSVFDRTSEKTVVTWSLLIGGHVDFGQGDRALELVYRMLEEGTQPDVVSFVCILKVCSSVGAFEQGKHFHGLVVRRGLETDSYVGSILIHMYSHCGSLDHAVAVFDRLETRNVVIYNALITGYAHHNNFAMAYHSLKDMQQLEYEPNDVTFLSLLMACSNLSLVEEGCHLIKSMQDEYAIPPALDHHNAFVDLLANAGKFHEAEDFLETMPFKANGVGWVSLLSSCRTYGKLDVGRRCFERALKFEPRNGSAYVLMSNIYTRVGMQECAARLEKRRVSLNAWKVPGKSHIEVDNGLHTFVVGDRAHPQSQEIYSKLEDIITKLTGEGSLLCLTPDNMNFGASFRDDLCGHSEKLAVVFGLITTPTGKTLRVTKNLRTCPNCHSVMAFISRSEGRKIVLIDTFCVHEFVDGACTCKNVYYKESHCEG